MISFVNTGLDEQILKSMPVEDVSEDLEKAMNKQGMVQKEVQVKGKNGTFTRKQWVRVSDVQTTQQDGTKYSKQDKDDAFRKYSRIFLKFADKSSNATFDEVGKVAKEVEDLYKKGGIYKQDYNKLLSHIAMAEREATKRSKTANSTSKGTSQSKPDSVSDPNMGKTLNVGAKKATVKSYDKLSVAEKREGADTIVSIDGKRYDYYSNVIANGIGSLVPHQDDPKIDMSAAQFKPGDKGMITIRSETIPVKVVDRATLNHKIMYLVQEDRPLAHGTPKKMYWTSDYNVKPIGGNKLDKPDKSTNNSQKTQDNLNTDSNRAKAENYLNYHLGSGETGVKVTSLETTKDGKVKVNYDVDVKISVGVDSETGQTEYEYDTEARSETYDLSDLGISSDTSKPTNNQDTKSEVSKEIKEVFVQKLHMPIPRSVEQAKSMLEDYKSRGYTSKKSRDAVIEASKLLGIDSNSNTTHQSTGGQKLSPSDAKKKTQEITKGVSDKKSFMEKAKAQGITWKENDHEGINWMRCCMAMNKYFENGGTFNNN